MNPLFKLVEIQSASQLGSFFNMPNDQTFGPAPKIVPFGSRGDDQTIDNKNLTKYLTTVNVTNEYPWTNAPRLVSTTPDSHLNARYDVPSLELREESIQLNPAFNNLARNLYIAADNAEQLANVYRTITANYGTAVQTGVNAFLASRAAALTGAGTGGQALAALVGGTAGAFASDKISSGIDEFAGMVKGFKDDYLGDPSTNSNRYGKFQANKADLYATTFQGNDRYLAPYQDIYSTKLTGWRYKFPYLEDQQRSNASAFGAQGLAIGGLVEKTRKMTTAFGEMFSPGVYIDTAQNFQFTGLEKSYSCSFPLLNTVDQYDIIRNWQLLFLLTYQNRPNRIDRVQIAPPKIYEAMIPGVWYCRHAYISNLSVDFVGNRRKMTLHVPISKFTTNSTAGQSRGNLLDRAVDAVGDFIKDKFTSAFEEVTGIDISPDSRSASRNGLEIRGDTIAVTTIIPDAYQVNMTLRELVPESQNTMFAAIRKPNTITVTTGDTNPFNPTLPINGQKFPKGKEQTTTNRNTEKLPGRTPGSSITHPTGHKAKYFGPGASG